LPIAQICEPSSQAELAITGFQDSVYEDKDNHFSGTNWMELLSDLIFIN
jgi:hypothetical protein